MKTFARVLVLSLLVGSASLALANDDNVSANLSGASPETMASAVLGILPLLAVFLLLQRQITQGVANTGIK